MTFQKRMTVCSAPRAMNRNPETWAKADEFYGFRFVKPEVLDKAQKRIRSLFTVLSSAKSNKSFTIPEAGKASEYTNLSDWQQWGSGKASWYVLSRDSLNPLFPLVISYS